MLTVVKVSVAQGEAYARYLEGRAARSAAGDYYLRDGERVEAPARWLLGALGADAIGVEDAHAPVDADAFRAVMAVVNPVAGGLLRRAGGNGSAVGAIDCTFSGRLRHRRPPIDRPHIASPGRSSDGSRFSDLEDDPGCASAGRAAGCVRCAIGRRLP